MRWQPRKRPKEFANSRRISPGAKSSSQASLPGKPSRSQSSISDKSHGGLAHLMGSSLGGLVFCGALAEAAFFRRVMGLFAVSDWLGARALRRGFGFFERRGIAAT